VKPHSIGVKLGNQPVDAFAFLWIGCGLQKCPVRLDLLVDVYAGFTHSSTPRAVYILSSRFKSARNSGGGSSGGKYVASD
jgi:hypothetical protein